MPAAKTTFNPRVQRWFEQRFGAPAPIQAQGWPLIGAGHDALLCAPTGSGKTLAAFLWSIDRLIAEAEQGLLREQVAVLYVSPLKALANDIHRNLEQPLREIAELGAAAGLPPAPIRAGLRTGDTSARERSAMLRRPPHILVTTPESLFILLTSSRFRDKLGAVRWVIVDELHALAGNKRGAHLAITLERLDRLVRTGGGARPLRIGLSATLNPIEELGRFLTGGELGPEGERRQRPCQIVSVGGAPRELDLEVLAPGPELGPLATHQHWDAMSDRVADLIEAHRTTLVFTLSRRWAERIALALQKRLGTEAVMAHHGSLAREERLLAEQKLKRGELKALVATASLELGIDVGAVELVCQVDSPKGIAAAIQRIGRSGHALGATPKGRFFALTLDDLLECAAAVGAIRQGELEQVEVVRGCLDVAAQQIVAIAAEEGDIGESQLLELLRRSHNFADLSAAQLRALLAQMAAELPEQIAGSRPKIFFDPRAARVRARRGARLAALTSAGTIPEPGNYDVVINSEQRKIGDVEEDFAQESSRGDVFALGSMPWQIQGISRGRLLVEAAPGMIPTLPFWLTEAAGRTPALGAAVSRLRHEIAARLGERERAVEFLHEHYALEQSAAIQAVDYVRRGLSALGALPDGRTLVAERFFDGLGGTQIVIHSPLGMRLNRGLGLALRKRLCQSFDFEIQASATDDGVLLALNSRHSFPLESIFTMVGPRTAANALTQAVLAGPMFEVRFRHVASRALAIIRMARGSKVPAWIQRLRAQDLIIALFPGQQACLDNRPPDVEIPDHFIVREALRECLTESTDLAGLQALCEGIERGAIRTLAVDSLSPSVFAQRLLLAWDYSFLDDGERANRRSRTVTLNRTMAEEVLRTEDLAGMLAESALAQVRAEVAGLSPARQARDPDELYELIRAHGALSAEAIAPRVAGEAGPMLALLAQSGRIVRFSHSALGLAPWIATEDEELFRAALCADTRESLAQQDQGQERGQVEGQDRGQDGQGAPGGEPQAARQEIVRRALRTSGPLEAASVAARVGLPLTQVEQALIELEAAGRVFRGHFDAAIAAEHWCDRYDLERIHRLTLERLRSEVEPAEDHEYVSFRLRWNHIGQSSGPKPELREILAQLEGLAFEPALWEQAILPARLAEYRPEQLDLLCLGGEVTWVAGPSIGLEEEIPTKVALLARGEIPWWLAEVDTAIPSAEHPLDQRVLDALRQSGAQYLDRLSERAGVSERDTLGALWRLAALGLASNDSFAPLRMAASVSQLQQILEPQRGGARRAVVPGRRADSVSRYDAALRARLKSSLGGRWAAVEVAAPKLDGEGPAGGLSSARDGARDLALKLLDRYGIISREVIAAEGLSWAELGFALRRLEYGGMARRGYFVRGLNGEQYALPQAAELLRAIRAAGANEPGAVALAAVDPANPFGAGLARVAVARESHNLVVIKGGRFIAGLAGHELAVTPELNQAELAQAIEAMRKLRRRLRLDTVGGEPALQCARVGELAGLGFHSDGRSLIYDGLPGPMPARAQTRPAQLG